MLDVPKPVYKYTVKGLWINLGIYIYIYSGQIVNQPTWVHKQKVTHAHPHPHPHTHTHTHTHIYIYIYVLYTHIQTHIYHTRKRVCIC